MNTQVKDDLVSIHDWLLSKNDGGIEIDMDTDLIENRLIDSLEFAEFLFLLEEVSGRMIDLAEIDLDSFRTLRSIEAAFCR